ncbi:hypothetical protein [Daejeonella oryzae]|uniref:hypothetical protein n=1 Tax=Daejeonella oryzae TaxID=1122943 RepID=UPI00041D85D1|nr:hypothetical protein [Daejeonella oryzae]
MQQVLKKSDNQQQRSVKALALVFISLFILTLCPVKRGLQILASGYPEIENSVPANKSLSVNQKQFAENSKTCVEKESFISLQQDKPGLLSASLFFPAYLISFNRLQAYIPDSRNSLFSFSKSEFRKPGTPIYILNRILLI